MFQRQIALYSPCYSLLIFTLEMVLVTLVTSYTSIKPSTRTTAIEDLDPTTMDPDLSDFLFRYLHTLSLISSFYFLLSLIYGTTVTQDNFNRINAGHTPQEYKPQHIPSTHCIVTISNLSPTL